MQCILVCIKYASALYMASLLDGELYITERVLDMWSPFGGVMFFSCRLNTFKYVRIPFRYSLKGFRGNGSRSS